MFFLEIKTIKQKISSLNQNKINTSTNLIQKFEKRTTSSKSNNKKHLCAPPPNELFFFIINLILIFLIIITITSELFYLSNDLKPPHQISNQYKNSKASFGALLAHFFKNIKFYFLKNIFV